MTKQTPNKKEKKTLGPVAIRHRKVLQNLTKNVGKGGKNTMVQAMVDEGYSKSYAENGNIKSGKTWKQLTEEFLGDDLLVQKHNSLLNFKKIEYMLFAPDIKDDIIYEIVEDAGGIVKKIVHSIGGTHCYFFKADGRVQKDATELAYKIRGKMSPEKLQVDVKDKFRQMSQQELADFIKAKKARFNKTD